MLLVKLYHLDYQNIEHQGKGVAHYDLHLFDQQTLLYYELLSRIHNKIGPAGTLWVEQPTHRADQCDSSAATLFGVRRSALFGFTLFEFV